MDGIIPLFKPKGPTSHDCVVKLRKMLKMKKIGHTGTLDPDVEGLLPMCVGEGTKVIPYLGSHFKEYVAEMELGKSTTTEDATGDVLEEAPVSSMPSRTEMIHVLSKFTGEITQKPPMYSAVKVSGKKLYEYAREGIEIDRPERNAIIRELELKEIDEQQNRIQLRVLCSKGTYIRTLCTDIGKALLYPAHMTSLIRTASDGILLDESIDLQTLEEKIRVQEFDKYALPVSSVLTHMDALETDKILASRVSNGQKLPLPDREMETDPFKMMYQGQLLAIYKKYDSLIKPVRVFNLNKR